MLEKTDYSAEIEMKKIPVLEGAAKYGAELIYPGNTTRNYNSVKEKVNGLTGLEFITLCDPQTSGGLLISVSGNKKEEFEKVLKTNSQEAFCIGNINEKKEKLIYLT